MNQQKDDYGFEAERFVASLLASLSLGHITSVYAVRLAHPNTRQSLALRIHRYRYCRHP